MIAFACVPDWCQLAPNIHQEYPCVKYRYKLTAVTTKSRQMSIERFGEKLKTLRLQHGLTTRELALQLHTTNSQISRVENGRRKPAAELILQAADYFDVPLDQLMRDELDLEVRP